MNKNTATWVHEFRESDYDIDPIILNAEGIYDKSWHNDVCPSFGMNLNVLGGSGDSLELSLWCEVDDPEQREAGEGKYTVTITPWGELEQDVLIAAGIPIGPCGESIGTTDDPREALNMLAQALTNTRAALAAAGYPSEVVRGH